MPSTRPAAARSSAWTSAAETEAFWTEFLRSLVARGLVGVQLAISDAHPGLKAALAKVLGAPWQRCTVHFLRDLRGHVRKDQHDARGALIRSIFTAPDGVQARARLADAVGQLEPRLPKVARLLEEAEDDVLAFFALPAEHWTKLRSTNPLERFNREIGRRTDVVGIFPDDASVIRLVSMLAIEANDEWLVGRAYISQKSMAPLRLKGRAEEEHQQRTRRGHRAHRGLSRQHASPTNRARNSYTNSRNLTRPARSPRISRVTRVPCCSPVPRAPTPTPTRPGRPARGPPPRRRRTTPRLPELKELGVRLSPDDFATGYSSMAYLKHLAVFALKLDRSFVRDMAASHEDAAIVALANALDLTVVAEGVAPQRAWYAVRDAGCDIARGFHLGRPIAADGFAEWLASRAGRSVA
jgi:hypothetical protein